MGEPIFGLNIPAPKIKISKENLEIYVNLYRGIRNNTDTVSWRTLIITIRKLLGVKLPDYKNITPSKYIKAKKLIGQLVENTYLEELIPEIEYALGVKPLAKKTYKDIDLLIVNGRHYPEPLMWSLADFAKNKGGSVAAINPVGHYNDGQSRVIGPFKYFHKIKKLVILASTQTQLGGSISVLANVIKLIRNPDLAKKVDRVEILIPMFGGSRGHRFGQSQEVGYEVMEAGFNAQILSLIARDMIDRLYKEDVKVPKIRFSTVDIHNYEYPKKTFNEYGFDFLSINSSPGLAKGIATLIKSNNSKAMVKLVACDFGAVPRTQNLAKEMLYMDKGSVPKLQIIYIEKKRIATGIVTAATFSKIEEWSKSGSKLKIRKVAVPAKPIFSNSIIVYSDDMIDTGGTAEKDLQFISGFYPNAVLKIFAATHPVFSKGFAAIKRIGADVYVLGNSLSWESLTEIKGVYLVDFAESIYEQLLQSD